MAQGESFKLTVISRIKHLRLTRKTGLPMLLGLVITAVFFSLLSLRPAPIEHVSDLLFDHFQRTKPRDYKPDIAPVRIIDIDNESIEKLGQWPWPRTTMARLNTRLHQAGAGVISYDIIFSEADRTSPENLIDVLQSNPSSAASDFNNIKALESHDALFAKSLAQSNAVLGFLLVPDDNDLTPKLSGKLSWSGTKPDYLIDNFPGSVPPIPALESAVAGEGFVSFNPKGDGIVRQAPMIYRQDDIYFRSLSLDTLRAASGAGAVFVTLSDGHAELMAGEDIGYTEISQIRVQDLSFPTGPDGSFRVYFTAPQDEERYVPAWKILSNDIPMEAWADKIRQHFVFVGASADGLKDDVATPIRAREPGVLVHAQIIEQILGGDVLKRPYSISRLENFILILAGLFLSFTLPFMSALWRGVVTAGLIAGVYYLSWWMFKTHLTLLSPVYALSAIFAVYVLMTLASFYLTESERSRIRNAFSMYLSPAMVKQVSENPALLTLGGEDRHMTILFLDIRGFSKISESMKPQDITTFLNIFLTPMTDILQAGKATIDKYIGDAIVAFWNAPLEDNEHEKNAARCVLKMIHALSDLNAKYSTLEDVNWPHDVRMGIGLNTGICCVGNLGSEQRFSYSMIGDAANLASRIEGLTKDYKVSALIGHETAQALGGFAILEADKIQVVGRSTAERIYILAGDEDVQVGTEFQTLRTSHDRFLALYRAQSWNAALDMLAKLKELARPFALEGYYDVMQARIETFKQNALPFDWDGVHIATRK